MRWRAICFGVMGLAGCQPADFSPQDYELANIRPSYVIPKSSPSQLIAAFRKYCLTGQSVAQNRLRRDDYLPVPKRRDTGVTSYVVDDTKPMVMLQPTGCAIAAEARSGQTHAIEDFVARAFAQAVPVDPAKLSPNAERLWVLPNQEGILYTSRQGAVGSGTVLLFARISTPEALAEK